MNSSRRIGRNLCQPTPRGAVHRAASGGVDRSEAVLLQYRAEAPTAIWQLAAVPVDGQSHMLRDWPDSVRGSCGYFEPHGRKDTIAKTAGLEMIPTKTIAYRGVMLPEMNTDAILRDRKSVV